MTTRIIIARHGNTFTADQTPTRVGEDTDLALVETERGTNIGRYLKLKGYNPVVVFAAPLKRTKETAELAIKAMGINAPLIIDHSFIEIDYGPDENKTEDEVELRLGKEYLLQEGVDISTLDDETIKTRGKQVIELWNSDAIVPEGWKVSPQQLADTWKNTGKKVEAEYKDKDVLIVSSNGIIRFAPYLTADFSDFTKSYDLKVLTGGVCVFEKSDTDEHWVCTEWNVKPKKFLE